MSRHVRVETRSRHQNDLKRVMHSTAKVRKWEKKWVRIEETSLQIFKWMPIKTEETLQPDTPLQQQLVADNQEFDKRKENMENVDLRNVKSNCIDSITTNNTSVTNGSSTMQAGPASTNTLDNRLLDHNMLNGSNNSVNHVQQDGMVQHIIPVSGSNMNKHPLESDNDESFFESAVDFPASKRLRTMPSDTSFIGLNIRQSQTVPVLSSEVKVIDDIETSMSNSSATVFSQMKPSSSVQAAMLHEQTSTVSHLIQTGSNQTSTATSSSSSSPSPMMISEGKLTNLSPTDIEMMDTEMAVDDCTSNISPVREQELNKLVLTSTKTMIDLEDFSDIARIVTEQIVTKVSDCHGNLLGLQDGK